MTAELQDLQVDPDGFVCVVAPDTYAGFVDANWNFDGLLACFVEQMNRGSLFVAHPGPDYGDCNMTFEPAPPQTSAAREVSGIVQVGTAGLWLTDYSQLTMAAQFSDESPIDIYSQRLPVDPGRCQITLREEAADEEPTFMLTVSPASTDAVMEQHSVPWLS